MQIKQFEIITFFYNFFQIGPHFWWMALVTRDQTDMPLKIHHPGTQFHGWTFEELFSVLNAICSTMWFNLWESSDNDTHILPSQPSQPEAWQKQTRS